MRVARVKVAHDQLVAECACFVARVSPEAVQQAWTVLARTLGREETSSQLRGEEGGVGRERMCSLGPVAVCVRARACACACACARMMGMGR